jgi:citrate synthase
MSSQHQATLTVHGEAPIHFSVLSPTHGKDCLDIRALGAKTGRFAYDSGFESTASCKSKITFVDGERGELLYHGYPIEQLARQCDFLEVAYLLKNGELPNVGQKEVFAAAIRKQAPVHEQMVKFYQGFRRDARPMAVMGGVVGALSAFDHQASEVADAPRRELSFHRIVARMPTIVAMAYKYSIGEPFMNPRNDLGYTANFLYMMFATPREAYRPQPRTRSRPRPTFRGACRTRAGCVDGDRAHGRLLGRQPLRLRFGGHRLPVGPGACRRGRGLPRNARRNR